MSDSFTAKSNTPSSGPTGSSHLAPTSEAARRLLEKGNQDFVQTVEDFYAGKPLDVNKHLPRWLQAWAGPLGQPGTVPAQDPFATVVSCSDARVPVRALFNCNANELFEIRVAGNVLAAECLGSIDYSLAHLHGMRALVVLGHTHCGAVTAAVDAYLKPSSLTASGVTLGLRSILHRLLGPVREAAYALERAGGEESSRKESERFRNDLINTSICVNAAYVAHELETIVKQGAARDVHVYYGVYDLANCKVVSLFPEEGPRCCQPGLAPAPPDTETLGRVSELVAARATKGAIFQP